MPNFLYQCFFKQINPAHPNWGALLYETYSDGPINPTVLKQKVVDMVWYNPDDGSPVVPSDVIVKSIPEVRWPEIKNEKPNGPSKQDDTFMTWAEWVSIIEPFNPMKFDRTVAW